MTEDRLLNTGTQVAIGLWTATASADKAQLLQVVAPDSPAAAAIKLLGARGPARVIGIPDTETPVRVSSGSAAADEGFAATYGGIATQIGEFPFRIYWSTGDRQIHEILPYANMYKRSHLPGANLTGFFGRVIDPTYEQPLEPIGRLDPVARHLWEARTHLSMAITVRSLAAWWRLEGSETELARLEPGVLAAAILRLVGFRAGMRGYYDEAAELVGVAADDVRRANPLIQKGLALSPNRLW